MGNENHALGTTAICDDCHTEFVIKGKLEKDGITILFNTTQLARRTCWKVLGPSLSQLEGNLATTKEQEKIWLGERQRYALKFNNAKMNHERAKASISSLEKRIQEEKRRLNEVF